MIATDIQLQHKVHEVVRLLMQRPITEAIACQVEDMVGFEQLEIEDGNWVGFEEDETMGGERHGWIESLLVTYLTTWAVAHGGGRVYTGDTTFVLLGTPQDIQIKRRPDVAFVANANVKPTSGYIYGAPQLAIEIISPTERPISMQRKVREYLTYGTAQVWQVFPELNEVVVHLPNGSSRTYGIDDTIDGGDLLPEFRIAVKSILAV
jgi:Uma2 family endonuclease